LISEASSDAERWFKSFAEFMILFSITSQVLRRWRFQALALDGGGRHSQEASESVDGGVE
jgi:hypothetical protein